MDAVRNLIERRSVRKFDGRKVDSGALDTILEAGLYAPSGMNRQGTILVAVRDEDTVELMSKLNAKVLGTDSDPFYGAKTVIVVFSDPEFMTYFEDGSLVMGNLLNAAHAIGVDSCWIHRAKEVFSSDEGKELMKKWGVPENYVGIGNCVLGYGSGEYPAARPRKSGRIIRVD